MYVRKERLTIRDHSNKYSLERKPKRLD